jgi:HPt (histidine-containing phosphotransfer) domain-containing protein
MPRAHRSLIVIPDTALPTELIYSVYGDDDDLAEMVEIFVAEIPHRVQTLSEALLAGRLEDLRRTAHQLKGAGGSYGFGLLSEVSARLEMAVRSGASAEDIQCRYDEVIDVCRRMRTGTASSSPL